MLYYAYELGYLMSSQLLLFNFLLYLILFLDSFVEMH